MVGFGHGGGWSMVGGRKSMVGLDVAPGFFATGQGSAEALRHAWCFPPAIGRSRGAVSVAFGWPSDSWTASYLF